MYGITKEQKIDKVDMLFLPIDYHSKAYVL